MFPIRGKDLRLKGVIKDKGEEEGDRGAVSFALIYHHGQKKYCSVIRRETSSGVQSKSCGQEKGGGEDGPWCDWKFFYLRKQRV